MERTEYQRPETSQATLDRLKRGEMHDKYQEILALLRKKADEVEQRKTLKIRVAESNFQGLMYNKQQNLLRSFVMWRVACKIHFNRPNQNQLQLLYDEITKEVQGRMEGSIGKMRQELDVLIRSVSVKLEQAQKVIVLVTNNRMREFGTMEKAFKGWRNIIWQNIAKENLKISWGATMGKLVRKMHHDFLMPWVLKAVFRNWANARGKSKFGKPKREDGSTTYGADGREEFGKLTCILPKTFFNPNFTYENMEAVEVDMEEMQRMHERVLGKTLNCYRAQMSELKEVIAQHQAQADDNQGRMALSRRYPTASLLMGGAGGPGGSGSASGFSGGGSSSTKDPLARAQTRSTESALRDAIDAFSTYDPAFPKQQSLEFRTERLVAYARRVMQENENLHAKLALTEKQRDRVLALRMNTELGPNTSTTRSQLLDDTLLREKLANAEAARDEAQLDLVRAKQQLVTVQQMHQLAFLKMLQQMVDMRSKVADQLPYNPVVEQCDLVLQQLERQGGLFAVGQEKAQADAQNLDKAKSNLENLFQLSPDALSRIRERLSEDEVPAWLPAQLNLRAMIEPDDDGSVDIDNINSRLALQ